MTRSRYPSKRLKLEGGIAQVDPVVSQSSAGPRGCIHLVFKRNNSDGSTVEWNDEWLTVAEAQDLFRRLHNVLYDSD